MKILFATTYIYRKEWPEFTKNRTGFGIMVNDIFDSVSEKVDAYLLTQVITNGYGNVLKHTWRDVFASASLKEWAKGFRYFFKYHQNIKGRAKCFYYALNAGTLRKTIRKIKPDVVHIHGIGTQIKPFIEICEEENTPYIVTLHGLISLDKTVHAAKWDKDVERDFLVYAYNNGIPVTVISTGMKHRIEKNYLHCEASNISVICNGTKFPFKADVLNVNDLDIRKAYGVKNEEKIIVVVGSVCERKNQVQIVKALATGKITTPCQIFFCGNDVTNGKIEKLINDIGLDDRVHLLGFLSRGKIEQILEQADLNIVASKDEGFGLSIIEAYRHGIPTVTFSDLDAVPDVYDERAMVRIDGRNDDDLATGIQLALDKNWDKGWIQKYSERFSMEKVAEQYYFEYTRAKRS